jgi:hypothetical protein
VEDAVARAFANGIPPTFPCRTANATCLEQNLTRLTRRAYQAPVDRETIEKLISVSAVHPDEMTRHQVAVTAALSSPRFLMIDFGGEMSSLDDHALARRLSSFLWSSVADEELLALAESGRLRTKETLVQQVGRMARDPRIGRFIHAFVTQWLELGEIEMLEKDFSQDPMFDKAILPVLRQETVEVFTHLLQNNRPISEILVADYSFLDDKLASFYGAPRGAGEGFQKVEGVPHRNGLLSHAGIGYVTAGPSKQPSVVHRGVWLSAKVSCNEPGAPPPGIPNPEDSLSKEQLASMTQKQISDYHSSQAVCAACHALIDPLGLALENFDGFGRFRSQDEKGFAIDTSGVYGGEAYADLSGLAKLLNAQGKFRRCLDLHLAAFALSRAPNEADECVLGVLGGRIEKPDPMSDSLLDVINKLVASEVFAKQGRQ